jgi:hypothetical protein
LFLCVVTLKSLRRFQWLKTLVLAISCTILHLFLSRCIILLHFVLQKWHPDKHGDANAATLKFQEINEAYRVLSDPVKRYEYDMQGNYALQDYSIAVSISSFLVWLVNFVHS